jgi:Spy/CpxP family protein refolding chaperone
MKKQRALMRQMWDEHEKLGDLFNAEKRDPAAIGKAYGKLSDLQRQALEARIDAENKGAAVLTKEQKAQMRRGFGRGMMGY